MGFSLWSSPRGRLRTLVVPLVGAVALSVATLTRAPSASAADGPLLTSVGATKAAVDLDVMTFNVRSALVESKSKDYVRRRPAIAGAILAELPDLVGTQEGVKWQQDNLWIDLKDGGHQYEWYGEQRELIPDGVEAPDSGETVAIFYRPERLEDLGHGNVFFCKEGIPPFQGCVDNGDGWRAKSPRMMTWIHFRDKTTKKEFYAVNTHLENPSGAGAEKARAHAVEIIRDTMAAMTPKLPIVLTGDFNQRTGGAHSILTDAGYRSAWSVAAKKGPGFKSFRGDGEPIMGGRIDFIYTHRNGAAGDAKVSAAAVSTFKDANGIFPSDHLPVLARIRLP